MKQPDQLINTVGAKHFQSPALKTSDLSGSETQRLTK